jgi:hypothetical protein
MYNMRLRQSQRYDIVNVCRKALETSLVSHETMYVYEKQFPATLIDRLDRQERVHRRRAWIPRAPLLLIWWWRFVWSSFFEARGLRS